jgi:hypothetical protein
MDTGLTLKPAASPAQTGGARSDPAARKAVATELAPAQTVTAANNTAPTPATEDWRKRDIILDPHSREVIYRAVDVRARRVIRQVPEEAMRRLRAYARATHDKDDGENALDTTA